MKRLAKIILGLISLTIGGAILLWCLYSVVVPNEYFRFRWTDVPRLFFPVVLIWVGWRWIRGEPSAAEAGAVSGAPYDLVLTLKLSGPGFGTAEERDGILEMKHRLEAALEKSDAGEIDGDEFGGGECQIYILADSPAQTELLIREFLASEKVAWNYTMQSSPEIGEK